MDFLDNISTGTKRYALFALLLCVGLLAYDCMATGDPSETTVESRAVR